MVNELLTQLGLSEKEINVYITVLQQGKITHANVAKLTKVNRTTAYSVAKELIDRGLITEDLGGSTTYLVARPPQDLISFVNKEQEKIEQKKHIAQKAVLELQSLVGGSRYSIPKIVFIAEDKLEDYLYKQTPVWDKSIMETQSMWWGFQDASFVKHYEKWIDWYWEGGSQAHVELQLLSNQSAEKIKSKKFARRKIKFWKGSKDFTATTWINGNFVIMIITSQRPHYLVEIHDAVLAHNMRELFKSIWQQIAS